MKYSHCTFLIFSLALLIALCLPFEASAQAIDAKSGASSGAAAAAASARAAAGARAAAAAAARAAAADRYKITVVTYGPGEHVFTKFGHNAIWVHDKRTKLDLFYNFGTLNFKAPNIARDFLNGTLRYWVSVAGWKGALGQYQRADRRAVTQELSLTPQQEMGLVEALRVKALQENRYYIYDYFTKNCSTHVRDFLDDATGGQLRMATSGPASMTPRDHTMRLTQTDLPVSIGMNLAMGPLLDVPISVWDEMYLPDVLHDTLTDVQIGEGKERRPLVMGVGEILASPRPPEPTTAPHRWPWMSLLGLLLGTLCVGLSVLKLRAEEGTALAKVSFALLWSFSTFWGFLSGLIGSLLTFFWVGTGYEIAVGNQNLLFFSPLALALPLAAVVSVFSKRARPALFPISLACTALALVGLLLQLTSALPQDSAEFAGLAVPIWCGLSVAWGFIQHGLPSKLKQVLKA